MRHKEVVGIVFVVRVYQIADHNEVSRSMTSMPPPLCSVRNQAQQQCLFRQQPQVVTNDMAWQILYWLVGFDCMCEMWGVLFIFF